MQQKYYYVKSDHVDRLIIASSQFFNQFTTDNDTEALLNSIAKIVEAISWCRNQLCQMNHANANNPEFNATRNDLAFCLRKYASVMVRNYNDSLRMSKSKDALEEALSLYNSENDNDDIIILEKQRSLHQLRHIAYELKDGILLKSAMNNFLSLLQKYKNKPFLMDCYESLFHLAFANANFKEALYYTNQCLNLCEESGISLDYRVNGQINYALNHLFLHNIESALTKIRSEKASIYYRHQSKICLAQLETMKDQISESDQKKYLTDVVEHIFWKTYDGHKNHLKESYKSNFPPTRWKKKLLKDLIFLFSIRCKKTLLNCDNNIKPIDYVLKQAEKVFGKSSSNYYELIKKTLNDKVDFIIKNHYLPLDYEFFDNIKPPNITISLEKIAILFPDIDLTKANENSFSKLHS